MSYSPIAETCASRYGKLFLDNCGRELGDVDGDDDDDGGGDDGDAKNGIRFPAVTKAQIQQGLI